MRLHQGLLVGVSKKSTVLILFTLFVASGLILAEVGKFPDALRLIYQPRAGTFNIYEMQVKTSAKLIGMEKEIYPAVPQVSTTFGRFIFSDKVLGVTPEGRIKEELTYKEVQLEMEVEGSRQNLPFADKLKGKSILMEFDRDGRVISAEGLDRFSEELKDLNIENMYVQLRPIFPDRELKIGDTWDNRTESRIPIAGMLVTTTVRENYMLSGFKEKGNILCAVIGVNLEIYTTGETVKREKEIDIDINMEGKGEGELLYAFEKSRLISSWMEFDLKSKIRSSAYRETQGIDMRHRIEMLLEEKGGRVE